MAIMSSMLRQPVQPLFSYSFMLYNLEVMSQCCNNFFTYLSIHISTVKHPQQNKWFNKWWKRSSMLPFTKTLLYDAFARAFGLRCSFFQLLSKTTYSFACKTSKIVTEVLQSIESITHAWPGSTLSQSALFKLKTFSYCMVVLE